jgi:hypothetical protein
MSLDISKVRSKLDRLKNKSKRGNNLWKPSPGMNRVRIVPYRYQKDFPFIELYFHYNLPGPNYCSPMSFGEHDPIAEFAQEVKRTGGQEGYEMFKVLMPKRRTFAPVLVRGEEDQGVRFYGFGKTIYEKLLQTIADPEWGDITDPKEGRDLKLEYIPRSKSDTDFPKTNMMISPNQTPLAETKDELKEIFESQVKITDVFDVPTEDELERALEDYLNGDEEEEEESVSENQSSNDDSDDFEEQFDQMFD